MLALMSVADAPDVLWTPDPEHRGRLAIVWGAHRWTADFIVPGR